MRLAGKQTLRLSGKKQLYLSLLKMLGNIELDGNFLKTTNLLLKQLDANNLALRDVADSAYKNMLLEAVNCAYLQAQIGSSDLAVRTRNANNRCIDMQAYDTDFRICLRLINGNIVFVPRTQPASGVEGAVYYDSTAKVLKFHNGTVWGNV